MQQRQRKSYDKQNADVERDHVTLVISSVKKKQKVAVQQTVGMSLQLYYHISIT